MPAKVQTDSSADVQLRADGYANVVLRGRLDFEATPGCWMKLQRELSRSNLKAIHVDASEVEFFDESGMALLRFLSLGEIAPGAVVTIHGLREEFQKRFEGFTAEEYRNSRPQPVPSPGVAEEVGRAASSVGKDLREQVGFIGSVAAAMARTVWNRKQMRWPEVRRVFELAGANALPIVSLISLLVGLIIAFESAQPLAQFGAQIYI